MNNKSDEKATAPVPDGRYLALVGGLLIVICVSLALLWMTERNRRINTEQRVERLQRSLDMMTQLKFPLPAKTDKRNDK